MRTRECPKCGQDISESHQEYDPDVGMMNAGWYCEACDVSVEDDDYGPEDD